MSRSEPAVYEFGPFRLDVARAELARDGRAVTLNPKAVELLTILIRHRGEVVDRDTLFALLWPDVHVTGANLTQTVYLLRRTLGKERNDQTYIETVPRRGYRFAASVVERARGPLSLAVLPFKVIGADANDYPLGLGTTDLLITRLSPLHQLARRLPENFDAYQAYIRGLYFWGKRTKEGLEKSIRYFTEALAAEPDYAPARAALADAYALAAVFLYDFVEEKTAFENARAEAVRAIELDETLPQAHAALFLVRHNYDMDRAGAETEIARAVELNPQYATAHLRYAFFHRDYGDLERALAEVRRAQQLDPLSMMNNYLLSEILYFMGRTDEALAYSEKAHETDPDAELVRLQLAYLYSRKSRYEDAVRVLEAIPDEPAFRAMKWGELGYAFAAAGLRERALEVLGALGRVRPEPLSHCNTALVYAGLGETELAFNHLAAETGRFIWLRPFYRFEPRLAPLRTDPRWEEMMNFAG